jgi:hypothetical protein
MLRSGQIQQNNAAVRTADDNIIEEHVSEGGSPFIIPDSCRAAITNSSCSMNVVIASSITSEWQRQGGSGLLHRPTDRRVQQWQTAPYTYCWHLAGLTNAVTVLTCSLEMQFNDKLKQPLLGE